MVYITGDTHGSYEHIAEFCKEHKTTNRDTMIILGDTCFNFYMDERDDWRKHVANALPITLFCIRGNHEERPVNVKGYVQKNAFGNKVYVQEAYPNILFATDGEIYEIADKKCLAVGGAYSVDKWYRLQTGAPWFKDEQLTEQEMRKIEEKLAIHNWKVDCVLTHTSPYDVRPVDLFKSTIDQNTVDVTMERWLQHIATKLQFDTWWFGHYHGNRTAGKYHMLYEQIVAFE